jgi:hypothetical protein
MTFSSCLPIFGHAIALDLGPGLGLIRLGRFAPGDGGMQRGWASSSCLRGRESLR